MSYIGDDEVERFVCSIHKNSEVENFLFFAVNLMLDIDSKSVPMFLDLCLIHFMNKKSGRRNPSSEFRKELLIWLNKYEK